VVETTIEDFAGMKDSRSGLLSDHTVINCNTSSIPLAAREASTYMRITLGALPADGAQCTPYKSETELCRAGLAGMC
jgi:vacuolar-type H+-ATPase catalytic subunit A/Vma1